ncbi:nitroreductase [Pseudonocardia kunmingensis]|uniref:Nitroreductase n=1 Tax=Pseudonocardia kunmingensis TaxID=630975 RepID=A0A543DPY6_9PSEU|nr:nitroreductase [Pseudonocardia kunmingensis]TQM11390.1 nitroreductase [Pseudonocardia kunmingensis]
MDVRDAVASRRSVRGFLDRPVDRAVLSRVLDAAGRAPSGGNLQPWRLYALTGGPLAVLKKLMVERVESGDGGDEREYAIYPPALTSPYRERRFRSGEQLYTALGISREDKAARRRWFARNYAFFGAPVGMFCYIDRRMGAAQWADLGMYLQTIMLLLRAEGLASCPQEAWSVHHRTVAEVVGAPAELMLFCGMAVGWEDVGNPANAVRIERAPLDEIVDFVGWGGEETT